ncbi:MAG: hypothetical protein ACOY3V_00600 [Pseudomonadota bacterium]
MLTLPLQPTDDRATPAFKDVPGCVQWLGQLQLTNLQLAHSLLLNQLDEFNRYPTTGLNRLQVLEQLRETVAHIQNDYAKKLTGKPLPLDKNELLMFVSLTQMWQAMVLGYQRCLQSQMSGEKQLAQYGAMLCQRCLRYSGLEIFEYLRTGYEFDSKLWHQLHELYAFAEHENFQSDSVADALDGTSGNCREIYVKTLLSCAAHPAELTRTQLKLLDEWLAQWCSVTSVENSYSISKGDAKPLATDLSSTCGLQPVDRITHHETMRYLEMVSLSKLLRVKTILLQQGQTPQQLGLGNRSDSEGCIELLTFLHQCWCESSASRFGQRRALSAQAQLCYGLDGIYAHLSGKVFRQSGRDQSVDTASRRQIETFGRVLEGGGTPDSVDNFVLENWQFEDESISGARLVREAPSPVRLNYNQLLAIKAEDGNAFMLGAIAWVSVTLGNHLKIGVRYLPGTVDAVNIRATGINLTVSDRYVPGCVLHALPALKIPASLILPRDWFQPARVVEVRYPNGETQHLKMGFSVERGIDYERVSFTLVKLVSAETSE